MRSLGGTWGGGGWGLLRLSGVMSLGCKTEDGVVISSVTSMGCSFKNNIQVGRWGHSFIDGRTDRKGIFRAWRNNKFIPPCSDSGRDEKKKIKGALISEDKPGLKIHA